MTSRLAPRMPTKRFKNRMNGPWDAPKFTTKRSMPTNSFEPATSGMECSKRLRAAAKSTRPSAPQARWLISDNRHTACMADSFMATLARRLAAPWMSSKAPMTSRTL